MPYVPHVRLTFGGVIGGGAPPEQWAGTIALGGDVTDPALGNLTDAELNQCLLALNAWHSRADTGTYAACLLQWVKAALIGADGRYVGQSRLLTQAGASGASGTNLHPFQIARVLTFEGAVKGPTRRGRLFSPAHCAVIDANGLTTAASALAAANSAQTLLSALGAAVPGFMRPVVASSKGYNTAILSVRVGRTLDTMRSRRTKIPEGYQTSPSVVTNA